MIINTFYVVDIGVKKLLMHPEEPLNDNRNLCGMAEILSKHRCLVRNLGKTRPIVPLLICVASFFDRFLGPTAVCSGSRLLLWPVCLAAVLPA